MAVETISRTVRFKKEDADLIDQFLAHNPFFDFSSLSRVAIMQFIRNPRLQLRPIQPELDGSKTNQAAGEH